MDNNYLKSLGKKFAERGLEVNSSATKVISNNNPFYTTLGPGPEVPLKSGDSEANILAKMYRFMTSQSDVDKKEHKTELIEQKKYEKTKEDRNDELVSLFDEDYDTKKKIRNISKHALLFGVGTVGLLFSGDVMAKIRDLETMFDDLGKDLKTEVSERKETPQEVDVGSLLETISSGESGVGTAGYEITFGRGRYDPEWAQGRRLTEMTMIEVERLQSDMLSNKRNVERTSAVGKYQIIKSTLYGRGGTAAMPAKGSIAEILDLKPEQKFTRETQERIGKELLKKRGLEEYKSGKISLEEFQERLSKEWAAIPSPKTGKSFYQGQKAGISQEKIRSAIKGELEPIREQVVENVANIPTRIREGGTLEERRSISQFITSLENTEEEEEDITEKVLTEKDINIPILNKKTKTSNPVIMINNNTSIIKQGDTQISEVGYDESDYDPLFMSLNRPIFRD